MNIGFITSCSYKCTTRASIRSSDYNQYRAHGRNVFEVVRKLSNYTDTLYDIGEFSISDKLTSRDDDIYFDFNNSGFKYSEITWNKFRALPGKKVVFILYYYSYNKESLDYIRKVLESDDIAVKIYYQSDDEIFFPGYMMHNISLNLLPNNFDLVLNGHAYIDTGLYSPMITSDTYKPVTTKKPEYDFYVNIFQDSRVLDFYTEHLPDAKFIVQTNEAVGEYLADRPNVVINVSSGRNTKLADIIENARKCKYYLIPNTYRKYARDWYTLHYVQDTMYTHKMIEAYLANRITIGDVSPDILQASLDADWYNRSEIISVDPVQVAREIWEESLKIIIDRILR